MSDWTEARPATPEQALAWIRRVADCLAEATRSGAETDEPEGSRYAVFSDTLLALLTDGLRHCVEVLR